MSGVDNVFAFDFLGENTAVGSEPDLTIAADFQAEQALAPDEAGDAGPAESQVHTGLTRQERSRLQEQRVAFQLDALDVARHRLSQD